MSTIMQRWVSPTPKFFKILRNVGLVIGAVGTAILTAPITLPATLITISGYLVTAGGVVTAVSQLTILHEDAPEPKSTEDES
jgi:ABC-type xylose transport system permease subunit